MPQTSEVVKSESVFTFLACENVQRMPLFAIFANESSSLKQTRYYADEVLQIYKGEEAPKKNCWLWTIQIKSHEIAT